MVVINTFFIQVMSQTFKKGREDACYGTPKKNQNEGNLDSEDFNFSPIRAPNSHQKIKHTRASNQIDSSQSKSNFSGRDVEEKKYENASQEITALKEQNTLLRRQMKTNTRLIKTLEKELEDKNRQYLKSKQLQDGYMQQLKFSESERDRLLQQLDAGAFSYIEESKQHSFFKELCKSKEDQIKKMKKEWDARGNETLKSAETEKQSQKLKIENRNHLEKIKKLQGGQEKLKKEIITLKEKLTKCQEELKKKTHEVNSLNQEKTKTLKKQQQERAKNEKELKDQIKRITDLKMVEEDKLKKDIKLLNQRITQSASILKENEERKKSDSTKIQNLLNSLERQKKEHDTLNKRARCLENFIGNISLTVLGKEEEEPDLNRLSLQVEKIKYFPDSTVFTGKNAHKQGFISRQIKAFLQIDEFRSDLLYRYDPLNPTNIHKYFDGHENLLIFVKLMTGVVIGGFTLRPYVQERNGGEKGSGFLFSLTLQKIFKQKPESRQAVTTYDNFYYIFGNAEIRIRTQEKKVFSNFGIATSTFDAEKVSRAEFLGVRDNANNELDIDTYEIYKLSAQE